MNLIEEYLALRNKMHQEDFRFDLSSSLWRNHYAQRDSSVVCIEEIREEGTLRGYAILEDVKTTQNKICIVRELIADGNRTFAELTNRIIQRSLEEDFDFILWRQCEEQFGHLLDKKGFLTLKESAVMMKLLNPRDFLLSSSSPTSRGTVMELKIKGFFPSLIVRVGNKSISIVGEDMCPQFAVSTDAGTFLRLMFGKASFWREFLCRRVKVGILHLRTAKRFFDLMENKGWYIPSGDWY